MGHTFSDTSLCPGCSLSLTCPPSFLLFMISYSIFKALTLWEAFPGASLIDHHSSPISTDDQLVPFSALTPLSLHICCSLSLKRSALAPLPNCHPHYRIRPQFPLLSVNRGWSRWRSTHQIVESIGQLFDHLQLPAGRHQVTTLA